MERYALPLQSSGFKARIISPAGRYLERLLLQDDALELFATYPVPQGWLFTELSEATDEAPPLAQLRQRLRSETSLTNTDVSAVVDVTPDGKTDLQQLRQTVASMTELEPEFFGNPVLNDTSLVLQVDVSFANHVRRRVLLTGDLENWAYLMAQHSAGLNTDVLKASHHGGYVYVEKKPVDFDSVYQWLRPSVALVSASGQHDLPKRGFRDAVAAWGATLFCPNQRGREIVQGKVPEEKSCFKAYGCSKESQKNTVLRITKDSIVGERAPCSSGVGSRVLPIIRIEQHVVQPSAVLERFEKTEVENHIRWVVKELRENHDSRVAKRSRDMDPVDVETLRTKAWAAKRPNLAVRLEQVLEYGHREAELWFEKTNLRGKGEPVAYCYCLPKPAELAIVQKWFRTRQLLLLTTTKDGGRSSADDLLDSVSMSTLGSRAAEEHGFPARVFRAAIWPSIAPELRQNFFAWRADVRTNWILLLPKTLGTEPDDAIGIALAAPTLEQYTSSIKEPHTSRTGDELLHRLEKNANVIVDTLPDDVKLEWFFQLQTLPNDKARTHLKNPSNWVRVW